MIYSHKGGLDRTLRANVANKFKHNISLYGSGSPNGQLNIKSKSLNEYMFSVAMENSIAQNYYTEKILDCFITGNIPIYRGCANIGDYFDKRGIITFDTLEELENILNSITKKTYEDMLPYAKINYNLAKNYINPDNMLCRLIMECINDLTYKTKIPFIYEK